MPVAVGELFLSAFLSVLFDRLTSREFWQFLRQEGLDLKIKIWENKLRMIEAVLIDAENKQITNTTVKMWLDDLRDLAYDIDDILDEFATKALARKLKIEEHNQQGISSKVLNFLPVCFRNCSPGAIKFNRSMESAMEDVTCRLEELYKHRQELGLTEITGGVSSSSSTAAVYQRPPTTSVATEPAIYGRDQDKNRVIQMVMKEDAGDARFRVTAIVGMGGVGKTTLAREVYNDTRMEDFESRAWVCVSEDFDVLRISKAVLELMTSPSCDYKELNAVQNKLKEVVTGKKFLLVLDDVWCKDYTLWETLKSPFMSVAQGSKIIVTTRHKEVALMMNPGEFFDLKLLSDEDCWSLFMSHASESKNISAFRDIEFIRKKIIENCKGLPLAAKILGGLLRSKQNEAEWLDVLSSKLWELLEKTEITTTLKLSYYHLPSNLKRCFAYCAILPKDYEFEEETLVHLWMAEGILPKSNDSRLEDLGHDYFRDLVSRSIFQESSVGKDKYVMHGLVSDLAQWASGESCFSSDLLGVYRQQSKMVKFRHYSDVCGSFEGKRKFEVLMTKTELHERLRTFLPLPRHSGQYSFISHSVLYDLLPKFSKLRALSLNSYYVTVLPESIGQMKHLRYFDLSYTEIKSLPESTCSLFNLQIIKLRNCFSLRELPSKLSNLINLWHLDIRGTILYEMPFGMRELKFLQVLTDFAVGKGSGARIKDIKHFEFLQGEFCISRLENVIYPGETNVMILKDLKGIKVLQLKWDPRNDGTENNVEKHVLDMLQPHGNVEELTIKCYKGVEFSLWLGNSVLSNVKILRLENCEKCTYLPSLGRLGSLKELSIKGLKGVKSIGHELYGEGCTNPFQLLEILCFQNLQEWEFWESTKENEHVQNFPSLRKLSIIKCTKLFGELPNDLSSLEELVIEQCEKLVVSLSNLPELCRLELDGCNKVVCSHQVNLKSLKSMALSNISEYHKWFGQQFEKGIFLEKAPPQKLQSSTPLTRLYIENCSNLISFNEVCFLTNLIVLEIRKCNGLASLPDRMNCNNPHLEELIIYHCNALTFVIKGQPPPSMRRLNVGDCKKLECVFDDKEKGESRSPSLLLNSPSVSCSFSRGAANLSLTIFNCSQLTSISSSGQLSEKLYMLQISEAPQLESIDATNLQYIRIEGCDNLNYILLGKDKLSRLQSISVRNCPNIVGFLGGGLTSTISFVSIIQCEKLEALPNGLHILDSLRKLEVRGCSSIKSFTEEGFRTNLRSLEIHNNEKMYKAVVEWGLHNLTSLTTFSVGGCLEAKSFPQEELGMQLPPTLKILSIIGFPKLEYLSSIGFQNLTSLQHLRINDCPTLTSFPKQGLPSSLLSLNISGCPLLKKECKRDKGKEWSKILHIPGVMIDRRFLYDSEEED